MGYFNYLRGKKGDDPPVVEMKELADVDESEEKFLPRDRDKVPLDRHMWVRKDVSFIVITIKSILVVNYSKLCYYNLCCVSTYKISIS